MSDHEDLLREHGELKAQVTRLKMELAVAHRERGSARADALEEAAKWHDQRADPGRNGDWYHRRSAAAIRALKPTPTPDR